jgi:hypothetical protein
MILFRRKGEPWPRVPGSPSLKAPRDLRMSSLEKRVAALELICARLLPSALGLAEELLK